MTPAETVRAAALRIRELSVSKARPLRGAFWETLAAELEQMATTDAVFRPDGTLDTTWCDEPAAAASAVDIAQAYLAATEDGYQRLRASGQLGSSGRSEH